VSDGAILGDTERIYLGDFEAAARCLSVVAVLLYRNADDFGKERFYYQASFRMMGSGCRKRTTIPQNESFPLSFLDCGVTA
jgi:hypothetical protein